MKGKEKPPKIISTAMMYEWPGDKSPVVMEYCVNDEHEDIIRKDPVEKNGTKANDEVR